MAVFLGLLLLQLVAILELDSGLSAQPIGKALSAIRVVLGFAYILFIPGYLLQALLFPRRASLDSIERAGMSLGLSIALETMLIWLLDILPWGVGLWPTAIGHVGLAAIFAGAAVLRRRRLPPGEADAPQLPFGLAAWWQSETQVNRNIYMFSGAVLLLVGAGLIWTLGVPKDRDFYSEFYLLGTSGLAENFPRQASMGEELKVILGVTNHERTAQTYRVEVWAVDIWQNQRQSLALRSAFELQPAKSWNGNSRGACPGAEQTSRWNSCCLSRVKTNLTAPWNCGLKWNPSVPSNGLLMAVLIWTEHRHSARDVV